jgi:hypothetical protein
VVEAALTRAQALWSNGDEAEAERERLEREAARLEAKIRRATEAVFAGGGSVASVVAGLKARERRLSDVRAALKGLGAAGAGSAYENVLPDLQRALADWPGLLDQETAHARQLLRKVFTSRVALTPQVRPDGRFYEFSVHASYGGLLRGLVPVNAYVAGSLPEPAMQWGDGAQGVSSPRPGGVSWHSAILLSSVL